MKTTAIIVAGGSGSRFGSEIPKQFVELCGQTVLERSISRFVAAPSVSDIVVVLSKENLGAIEPSSFEKAVRLVEGGETRAHSVKNGISAVSAEADIIAVHDAARPLVTVDEIERTIQKAIEMGAACLTAEVTDTLKAVRSGEITDTIDRTRVRRALTPQAFAAPLIRRAFDDAVLDETVTDECCLVQRLGHPIAIVDGSANNIKITRREDIFLAEALLKMEEGES